MNFPISQCNTWAFKQHWPDYSWQQHAPTISRHAVPAMQSSAPAAQRHRRRRQETMHPPRNGRRNQSAQLGDEVNCCTDFVSNGHVWKSCLNCALHSSKHYLVENILRHIWMMESGLISNIAIHYSDSWRPNNSADHPPSLGRYCPPGYYRIARIGFW